MAGIKGKIPEYPLIRAANIVELNVSETLIDDHFFVFTTMPSQVRYRSFSRDVTELMSAMLVHIRVACFSKKYMKTESKFIILVSSQSKNMASEKKIHSFI